MRPGVASIADVAMALNVLTAVIGDEDNTPPLEITEALDDAIMALAVIERDGAPLIVSGLIVNAIVRYNTIYTQRALDHRTATGLHVVDIDIERLSPLGSDHLTLTGRYRIAITEALRDRSAYRELNAALAVAA